MLTNFMRGFDKKLAIIVVILLVVGTLALVSASYQRQIITGKNFFFTQMVWISIGLAFMLIVSKTSYNSFLSVAYIIYGIHIISLILVLCMGKVALGAQRWISIGGIGFQPSEFSKIFTILILARVIGDNPQRLKTLSGLIPLCTILILSSFTPIFIRISSRISPDPKLSVLRTIGNSLINFSSIF